MRVGEIHVYMLQEGPEQISEWKMSASYAHGWDDEDELKSATT